MPRLRSIYSLLTALEEPVLTLNQGAEGAARLLRLLRAAGVAHQVYQQQGSSSQGLKLEPMPAFHPSSWPQARATPRSPSHASKPSHASSAAA